MFLDTAIQSQPIFDQWVQNSHALAHGITAPGATSIGLTWGDGELVAVYEKVALLPIPLGTVNFLVHHIHAFTIHVTVLLQLEVFYLLAFLVWHPKKQISLFISLVMGLEGGNIKYSPGIMSS